MSILLIIYKQAKFNNKLKGLNTLTKWDLSLGWKAGSLYINQLMWCTALMEWRKHTHTHTILSIDAEKHLTKFKTRSW